MMFDFADDRFGTRFGLRRGAVRFQFALEIAEVGEHLLNRLVTFVTFFAQSLLQNRFEFERNIRNTPDKGRGSVFRMEAIQSLGVVPGNGGIPLTISKSTTPKLQISERASTFWP